MTRELRASGFGRTLVFASDYPQDFTGSIGHRQRHE